MNTFTKKLLALVIIFIVLIPALFFGKSKLEERETKKILEKNEKEKKDDKKVDSKKEKEQTDKLVNESKKSTEQTTTEKNASNNESESSNKSSDSINKDKKEESSANDLKTDEDIKKRIDDLRAEIKEKRLELKGLEKRLDKEKEGEDIKALSEKYDTKEVRNNMEDSSYSGEKLAFLTFDDGVNTLVTPRILQTLKDNEINATFFIPGYTLEDKQNHKVLKNMYMDGNTIATHSYHHDYNLLYPNRSVDAEIIVKEHEKTVKKMKKILGDDFNTNIFRYPGGHMSWDEESIEIADKELEKIGVNWIDWNSMTGDAQPVEAGPNDISRPTNVDEVIANFEQSLSYTSNPNQVVILMHDAYDKDLTADALQALINHLKSEGYEFGTLK